MTKIAGPRKFGVIFDCDGTLIKSLDLGMGSYNYALEKIGERYREPDEIKRFFGAGADRIFLQLLGDEEKALEAFNYYFEHESKQVDKIFLHDGIKELLDSLNDLNIPMGVVTGRHFKDLDLIFNHHKLFDYFKALICDNHLPFSKPAPDGILMAASQMSLSAEEIYYIGDSVMDIQAANRAGSKSIAALWDNWARESEMIKENPTFTARTPHEILNFLNDAEGALGRNES